MSLEYVYKVKTISEVAFASPPSKQNLTMNILNLDFTKMYVCVLIIFAISAESKKTSYHSGRSQITRVGKRYGDGSNYSEVGRRLWTNFPRVGRSWGNSEDNQDKGIWYQARWGGTAFIPNRDEIDQDCIILNNDNSNLRQYGRGEENTIDGVPKFSDRQPPTYFEK